MTDEQVKQNAEQYAKAHTPLDNWETDKALAKFAFIAGAHSRDEEIKELNTRIVNLMCERDSIKSESEYLINKLRNDNKDLEQALACAEDVVDIQCKELDQLRNPWISVEERLPEKGRWVVLIGSRTGHPYVNMYTGGRKWGGWRCFMPKVTKWKYVDE